MNKIRQISIGLFFLSISQISPTQAREINYANDKYGYLYNNSCQFEYVDINSQATTLTLTASGLADAGDDGGSVINLLADFQFYDKTYNAIVVSSNGYIAFADSLNQESGGDFSNDCLLPSVPDTPPVSLARILPLHDELEKSATGIIQTAFYSQCPRTTGQALQACTIIEWVDWKIRNQIEVFSFQVILYHQSADIVFQYNTPTPINITSASIGIQNQYHASIYACNDTARTLANCVENTSPTNINPSIFKNGFE